MDENSIEIYKADVGVRGPEIPNLRIVATKTIPSHSVRVYAELGSRPFFQRQAEMISKALFRSLPGGTLSALTVEFLKHELSVRTVPDVMVE